MNYWLLKTEPNDYSYADLVTAGSDVWDGVRNHQAQSNLRKMTVGDLAFIYHTGKEKAIIGVADVIAAAFPDPTNVSYQAVKLRAQYRLPQPVTLKEIKALPQFAHWALVRQARLSVMPVTPAHWHEVINLATPTDSQ
ncbi:MAG: EVE domain-containing protein [Firmicutes bacterium]|nr:EVE domain-containing protein [Bacillota bacterium]